MSVEILRPNASGSETSIDGAFPSVPHWQNVDEVTADDNTTRLQTYSTSYQRDLYGLSNPTDEGIIDSVTIYFRIGGSFSEYGYGQPSQKSGAIITDGDEQAKSGSGYVTKSQTYTNNPATGSPYTLSELDNLQVGFRLRSSYEGTKAFCTQVYVEVNYHTPQTFYQNVGQGILAIAGILNWCRFARGATGEGILAIAGELGIAKFLKRSAGQGTITISGAFDTRKSTRKIVGQGVVRIKGAFKTTFDRVLEIYSLVFAKSLEIHSLTFTKNLEIPFMDSKRALIIICEPIGG